MNELVAVNVGISHFIDSDQKAHLIKFCHNLIARTLFHLRHHDHVGARRSVFAWLVWQDGLFGLVPAPGPLISFMPIFLIGVTFGLAMDYMDHLKSGV